MTASYQPYILNFKQPSGTSRGVLKTKETWFIKLKEGDRFGIGECGILRGLSADDRPDYEAQLAWTCQNIQLGLHELYQKNHEFPSIQFGLETAFKSLESKNPFELFPSEFSNGNQAIPINGLIWMGDKAFMKQQIKDKLAAGFSCIKMKIGAIDFDTELSLLKSIRETYTKQDIELRVDANGAFSPDNALDKLNKLSELDLHSIEQPIKPHQWQEMAKLCEESPLPIALDEELIGVFDVTKRKELLQTVKPQYIILKPSFIGGWQGSQEWIDLAHASGMNIGWWLTSALESNIGLNAIAQYTSTLSTTMPQGLGTGSLYTNNMDCPLTVEQGHLHYDTSHDWDLSLLKN